MRILKVKATREELPGRTHYVYPPEYNAKKIQVLSYELSDEHKARNDGKQYLIGVVKDADADEFLKSPDIEEINEISAREDGRRWRPQREKILDEQKVMQICAKAIRGQKLTQQEKDALDPDKLEQGINKGKGFDDLLDEYKNKL